MNTISKTLSVILCATLHYGCGTPDQQRDSVPVVAVNPLPEIGKITLIRIEPEPSAPELLVSLTGTLSAVVGNLSYATIPLPVGTNIVTFDWEDTPLKFEEEIVLEADGALEKYLSVVHQFQVPEISKKEDRTDYTMQETLFLFELPASFATNMLKNLDPSFSYSFDCPDSLGDGE